MSPKKGGARLRKNSSSSIPNPSRGPSSFAELAAGLREAGTSCTGEPLIAPTPHPGQQEFLASDHPRRLLVAHRRFGKDWGLHHGLASTCRALARGAPPQAALSRHQHRHCLPHLPPCPRILGSAQAHDPTPGSWRSYTKPRHLA